jgi:hypothetical protein
MLDDGSRSFRESSTRCRINIVDTSHSGDLRRAIFDRLWSETERGFWL